MSREAEHVCTKKCLRWAVSLGRRWYYCKDQPVTVVKLKERTR